MKNVFSFSSARLRPALTGLGFAFAVFLSLTAFQSTARADSVTLTEGTATIQVNPGQTSLAFSQAGVFSLTYLNTEFVGPLSMSLNFQSITQGFGSATLNGVTTQYFTGFLVFNNDTLSGNLSAFGSASDAFANNPLFTVTFSGGGFLTSTSTRHVFTIATPEPATLSLLGLGATFLLSKGRRRRRRSEI
jgi:hypothetical protein